MKYEEYYGEENYRKMTKTAKILTELTNTWCSERMRSDLEPIVYAVPVSKSRKA